MKFVLGVLLGSLLILLNSCKPIDKLAQQTSKRQYVTEEWMLGPFEKRNDVNPILSALDSTEFLCPIRGTKVKWEEKDVFNPAAIVKDGNVYILYRAEDNIGTYAGTSRIGLAVSTDGVHFKRHPLPVLYPDNDSLKVYEWEGGCEDPRIIEGENGVYYLYYTVFNGEIARLCVASSTDLYHWNKHGMVFGKVNNGELKDYWSKSGSVITSLQNGRLKAAKVNGKYWMYFGESEVFIATSDNLIDWVPLERSEQMVKKLKYLGNSKWQVSLPETRKSFRTAITTRQGRFDSGLVEPGPPALLTDKGILFIYNGANSGKNGDNTIPANAYCGGQVLFDATDPTCVINRCKESFFLPDSGSETLGQVNNVCFLESLVYFNNTWILYYGMADSKVGMAVCKK
jgi:predicted GH43/DUF377 family glycosyl hydrolase